MPTRSHARREKAARKRARPPEPQEEHELHVDAPAIPDGLITAEGENRAGTIAQAPFQTAQRQALVSQIGQVRGNRSLQRMLPAPERPAEGRGHDADARTIPASMETETALGREQDRSRDGPHTRPDAADRGSHSIVQAAPRAPRLPKRPKTIYEQLEEGLQKKAKKQVIELLKAAPGDVEFKYAQYMRCLLTRPNALREDIKAAFPADADAILGLLPKTATLEEVQEEKRKKRIKEATAEFPEKEQRRWRKELAKLPKDNKRRLMGLWLLDNWVALRTDPLVKHVLPKLDIGSPVKRGVDEVTVGLMPAVDNAFIRLLNQVCWKDIYGPGTQQCCQELRNWGKLFGNVAPKGDFAEIMRTQIRSTMKDEKYKYCKFTSKELGG